MRLHLLLHPQRKHTAIPFNYIYSLSSAIYRWIEDSSPAYSSFLHNKGFSIEGTIKKFRHFCFSQLNIPRRKIFNGSIIILTPTVDWYISMPVEESVQHLVTGIFERQEFFIGDEENRFVVEQVETLPDPPWERIMKFRMLSPVTVSIPEDRNGKFMPHYLQPDDPHLNEALRTNILNKYLSLYNHPPSNTDFRCTLDQKFISDRGGITKITKLITIKEGRQDETKVRGFMCPLTIEGNPELIKLAYESGLGEKGSMGFGMIESRK